MKIRSGFVSNSSSCSFCLGKTYLTEEQIKEINSVLDKANDEDCDTYISESKFYFLGNLGQNETILKETLKKLDVEKYCATLW